jgi:hypothetical protein
MVNGLLTQGHRIQFRARRDLSVTVAGGRLPPSRRPGSASGCPVAPALTDTWADTTTAHGRLMLTVLGGLAEFERELILPVLARAGPAPRPVGCGFGRPPAFAGAKDCRTTDRVGLWSPRVSVRNTGKAPAFAAF